MLKRLTLCVAGLLLAAPLAMAEEAAAPRVLFLCKSSGFQHSVIARLDDAPSLAETVMTKVVEGIGGTVQNTKDAKLINAENLKNYDVVVFYTTGDLTEPGFDRMLPMAKEGPQELLDWIKAGGGFVGFHCATDTFHGEGDTVTPYIEMIGGEFAGHGPQFFGEFTVVSPSHPTMAPFKSPYRVNDEWYFFKNLNTENIHVLALLDATYAYKKMKGKGDAAYAKPYPIAWCRAYGDGRVFYNAMGHREDVWESEVFQQSIASAVRWARGEGELNAEPNYAEVMAGIESPAEEAPAE